jgi:UDP-GlcNAc:undecaprenyl-phosphate/decaprenyl-phosphate GlcNAc-1-phosphate transferase
MLSYYVLAPLMSIMLFVIYYIIGKKAGISDNPVGRSSHKNSTITGAGIVFTISFVVINILYSTGLPLSFFLGLILLATISFIDDIKFVKHSVRFVFQIFGLALLVSQISIKGDFSDQIPVLIAGVLFGIGVLNGFNFIDGINGMLGLNTLVILISLIYLNETLVNPSTLAAMPFANPIALYSITVAVLVFLFLNFRTKAVFFMGDVGSISLGFIVLFFIYQLISKTGNLSYLLLFSVIGIDSGLTVIYKLIQKENIFIPHRDFLFKKLVHIGRYGHVRISSVYALTQLAINALVILLPFNKTLSAQVSVIFILVFVQSFLYINTRNKLTKQRIWSIRKPITEKKKLPKKDNFMTQTKEIQ